MTQQPMCLFHRVQQARLHEENNGACGQVICCCESDGDSEKAEFDMLDAIDRTLLRKWGDVPGDTEPLPSPPSDAASVVRCNECKIKQCWLYANGCDELWTCYCLTDGQYDHCVLSEQDLIQIQKWGVK